MPPRIRKWPVLPKDHFGFHFDCSSPLQVVDAPDQFILALHQSLSETVAQEECALYPDQYEINEILAETIFTAGRYYLLQEMMQEKADYLEASLHERYHQVRASQPPLDRADISAVKAYTGQLVKHTSTYDFRARTIGLTEPLFWHEENETLTALKQRYVASPVMDYQYSPVRLLRFPVETMLKMTEMRKQLSGDLALLHQRVRAHRTRLRGLMFLKNIWRFFANLFVTVFTHLPTQWSRAWQALPGAVQSVPETYQVALESKIENMQQRNVALRFEEASAALELLEASDRHAEVDYADPMFDACRVLQAHGEARYLDLKHITPRRMTTEQRQAITQSVIDFLKEHHHSQDPAYIQIKTRFENLRLFKWRAHLQIYADQCSDDLRFDADIWLAMNALDHAPDRDPAFTIEDLSVAREVYLENPDFRCRRLQKQHALAQRALNRLPHHVGQPTQVLSGIERLLTLWQKTICDNMARLQSAVIDTLPQRLLWQRLMQYDVETLVSHLGRDWEDYFITHHDENNFLSDEEQGGQAHQSLYTIFLTFIAQHWCADSPLNKNQIEKYFSIVDQLEKTLHSAEIRAHLSPKQLDHAFQQLTALKDFLSLADEAQEQVLQDTAEDMQARFQIVFNKSDVQKEMQRFHEYYIVPRLKSDRATSLSFAYDVKVTQSVASLAVPSTIKPGTLAAETEQAALHAFNSAHHALMSKLSLLQNFNFHFAEDVHYAPYYSFLLLVRERFYILNLQTTAAIQMRIDTLQRELHEIVVKMEAYWPTLTHPITLGQLYCFVRFCAAVEDQRQFMQRLIPLLLQQKVLFDTAARQFLDAMLEKGSVAWIDEQLLQVEFTTLETLTFERISLMYYLASKAVQPILLQRLLLLIIKEADVEKRAQAIEHVIAIFPDHLLKSCRKDLAFQAELSALLSGPTVSHYEPSAYFILKIGREETVLPLLHSAIEDVIFGIGSYETVIAVRAQQDPLLLYSLTVNHDEFQQKLQTLLNGVSLTLRVTATAIDFHLEALALLFEYGNEETKRQAYLTTIHALFDHADRDITIALADFSRFLSNTLTPEAQDAFRRQGTAVITQRLLTSNLTVNSQCYTSLLQFFQVNDVLIAAQNFYALKQWLKGLEEKPTSLSVDFEDEARFYSALWQTLNAQSRAELIAILSEDDCALEEEVTLFMMKLIHYCPETFPHQEVIRARLSARHLALEKFQRWTQAVHREDCRAMVDDLTLWHHDPGMPGYTENLTQFLTVSLHVLKQQVSHERVSASLAWIYDATEAFPVFQQQNASLYQEGRDLYAHYLQDSVHSHIEDALFFLRQDRLDKALLEWQCIGEALVALPDTALSTRRIDEMWHVLYEKDKSRDYTFWFQQLKTCLDLSPAGRAMMARSLSFLKKDEYPFTSNASMLKHEQLVKAWGTEQDRRVFAAKGLLANLKRSKSEMKDHDYCITQSIFGFATPADLVSAFPDEEAELRESFQTELQHWRTRLLRESNTSPLRQQSLAKLQKALDVYPTPTRVTMTP